MLLLDKLQLEKIIIDEITDDIYICTTKWYTTFNENAGDILDFIQKLIAVSPLLEKMGIEIPVDVLENQISKVNEAVSEKDFMLLADVLKYEIKDSLCAFEELVEGGIVKNEELL